MGSKLCAECDAPLCEHEEVFHGEFQNSTGQITHSLSIPCRLYLGHAGAHDYQLAEHRVRRVAGVQ